MRVGSTIAGKYRITSKLGAGGMGEVMAAVHVHLETAVALKFLQDTTEQSVQRFLREARASAQLKSEHVCRVTDFGLEDGTPYLAMELLEGEDLAVILKRNKLDVETAVHYVSQACVGIAEAHAAGIVHRDLKPGNLFLTLRPDGSPLIKVLDFGVAKVPMIGDVGLTHTSHVVGSPAYMSPEQVRSSRTVDHRADIWALGVVLYELVSGRHPFYGASIADLVVSITRDKHRPLVEAPELEPIIARCLAKQPGDRYEDVGSLAEVLARFGTSTLPGLSKVAQRILNRSGEQRPTLPYTSSPYAEVEIEAGSPTVAGRPERDAVNSDDATTTTLRRSSGEKTLADPPPPRRPPRPGLWLGVLGLVAASAAAVVIVSDRSPDKVDDTYRPVRRPPTPPAPMPAPAPTRKLTVAPTTPTDPTPGPVPDPAPIQTPPAPPPVVIADAPKPPKKQRPKVEPKLVDPESAGPTLPVTRDEPDDDATPAKPAKPETPPCSIAERRPDGSCPPAGLDPVMVSQKLAPVLPAIERCDLLTDTHGKVEISVRVAPNGSVVATSVIAAPDPALGACVARTVAKVGFAATPSGGTFTRSFF